MQDPASNLNSKRLGNEIDHSDKLPQPETYLP